MLEYQHFAGVFYVPIEIVFCQGFSLPVKVFDFN